MTGTCCSAPLPKFVIHRGTLSHELRKQLGTSKDMILVPLFDLTFLNELAAGGAGTSNRRHQCPEPEVRTRDCTMYCGLRNRELASAAVVAAAREPDHAPLRRQPRLPVH